MEQKSRFFMAHVMNWQGVSLVNICDEELVGATISDGKREMHISRDYFGGELIDGARAVELIRSASVANLVGERIVHDALRARLASEQAVKRVKNTPFLMIFKFHSR